MRTHRVTIRYAKAAVSQAQQAKVLEVFVGDIEQIQTVISKNPQLIEFLSNPVIRNHTKTQVLFEIFPKAHSLTKNLIRVLSQNKRLYLLSEVCQKINVLYQVLLGKKEMEVITAVPITKELEKRILAKVNTFFKDAEISLKNTVKPSTLGGFVLIMDDMEYDASMQSKLKRIKKEFIKT